MQVRTRRISPDPFLLFHPAMGGIVSVDRTTYLVSRFFHRFPERHFSNLLKENEMTHAAFEQRETFQKFLRFAFLLSFLAFF